MGPLFFSESSIGSITFPTREYCAVLLVLPASGIPPVNIDGLAFVFIFGKPSFGDTFPPLNVDKAFRPGVIPVGFAALLLFIAVIRGEIDIDFAFFEFIFLISICSDLTFKFILCFNLI